MLFINCDYHVIQKTYVVAGEQSQNK